MDKLWFLLLAGYLMAVWAAGKRNAAGAALCFLDGVYLAMLCFAVLPPAMGSVHFWGAAGCAGAGVAAGLLAETYLPWDKALRRAVFLVLTAAVFFSWELPVFPLAFFGGMGLYHASAGIVPEPLGIGRALCGAGGFLAGVFLFSPLL